MDHPIERSGPDYVALLRSSLSGGAARYRLLATALREAIDRGDVPRGTVLPAERSLAHTLGVSRSTVVAAYEQLKAQGWLDSRQGSGTWVQSAAATHGIDAVSTRRLFAEPGGELGLGTPDDDGDLAELSVAALRPSPTVRAVLASLTAADVDHLARHHGYLPAGTGLLREVVAARLTADGLPTAASQVVVTNGAHQAVSLIVRQVLRPGDSVVVESPTYPGALDVFRRFDARAVPIPVDADGPRTELLPDLLERTGARLVFLTPHFHSPTGSVMPDERRLRVAEIADRTGVVVIEDRALADMAIDDIDLPAPIAAHARGEGVHVVGSVSKLFWAGLRIGWVRSPASWHARMLSTKTVADLGSSPLTQLLAARLLEQRDVVLTERRPQLRRSRDLLCARLAEQLGDWTFTCPPGGLTVWAELPAGHADELADVAFQYGVDVVAGSTLSVDHGNRRGLRLTFAADERTITVGVDRLAAAWEAYRGPGDGSPRLLV